MVDVLFSDSDAGSLKAAYILKNIKDYTIIYFDLMLDVGFLQDGIDSKYRRNLPPRMINSCFDYHIEDSTRCEYMECYMNNLRKLEMYIQKGEDICIWYSNTPRFLCGLYFVCSLIKDAKVKVYANLAPDMIRVSDHFSYCKGWTILGPENICDYIDIKHQITKEKVAFYAHQWKRLVDENAPLRTNIGNMVISVPENFYDPIIDMYITDLPIKENEVIGHVLGTSLLPVKMCLIHDRIQHMVDNGTVKVTNSYDKAPSRRYIRKATPKEIIKGHSKDIEERILEELIYNAHISQNDISENLGLPLSKVRNILKRFKEQGKIVRIDGNSHGYWKINEQDNT